MRSGADDSQSMAWPSLILVSAFALIAAVWPLSSWLAWYRPELPAILVIYAVLLAPFRIGMVYAWGLGLLLDIFEGATLGQNALSLTVVAYLCFLLHPRIRLFSLLEQALSIFVLVGINQLVGNWVQGLTGVKFYDLAFLIPAFTSALLWPAIQVFFDRLRLLQ